MEGFAKIVNRLKQSTIFGKRVISNVCQDSEYVYALYRSNNIGFSLIW